MKLVKVHAWFRPQRPPARRGRRWARTPFPRAGPWPGSTFASHTGVPFEHMTACILGDEFSDVGRERHPRLQVARINTKNRRRHLRRAIHELYPEESSGDLMTGQPSTSADLSGLESSTSCSTTTGFGYAHLGSPLCSHSVYNQYQKRELCSGNRQYIMVSFHRCIINTKNAFWLCSTPTAIHHGRRFRL